ncbi:MAG TPA: RagB/SusD family nutrient uptake outer membrane protein, partial [Rikenellaceae bacterium]|nr:RagB/SusD family nutrient uptake outer membrane protein [Rikenellaceae bacterium]
PLTKDEVKNEKRFELYLEGSRFFDLVRWGDAATVLANNGKSVPTAYDKINEGSATHELEIRWASYNKNYGFKAGKNENVPYPFSETSVNPNIKQNVGW